MKTKSCAVVSSHQDESGLRHTIDEFVCLGAPASEPRKRRRIRPRDEWTTTTYDYRVSARTFTPDQLTELLDQFHAERARGKTFPEIADQQIQEFSARVAALTDALRDAESNETARLASRILLSDLRHHRGSVPGRANATREVLAKTLADVRAALTETPGRK